MTGGFLGLKSRIYLGRDSTEQAKNILTVGNKLKPLSLTRVAMFKS